MLIIKQHHYCTIQAIAWIPFFNDFLNDYRASTFQQYSTGSWQTRQACNFLFRSGNYPSPDPAILTSVKNFDDYLANSKNYRGALALRGIRLDCLSNGKYEAHYYPLQRDKSIGFTPYRNFFTGKKKVWAFKKGTGGRRSEFEPSYRNDMDGVKVEHIVYFRIGWLGNMASKLFTGYFAPKAKMLVEYKLVNNGSCTIHLAGSYIPNQAWNIIGYGTRQYDMMGCTPTEIDTFFKPQKNARNAAQGNYPSIVINIP